MTAIRAEELLGRKVSRFNGVRSKRSSSDYSLRQCLGEVRGTKHKALVEKIRNASRKTERDALKKKLPCISLSGAGNRNDKKDIIEPHFEHSGLLQMDFDLKDNNSMNAEIMSLNLKNDKHVVAYFLSPSGGIKAVVPIHQSVETHKQSFKSACNYFHQKYGMVADEKPKNHRSLCFLSYDPDAFVCNDMVTMFEPNSNIQVEGNTVTQTRSNTVTQLHRNAEEYKQGSGLERLKHKRSIKDRVEKWKDAPSTPHELVELWNMFIDRRYKPNLGERNKILCEFIPFAHKRMSKSCAMELALVMREVWDCVCTDPIDQHMREAESLWMGCENTFIGELTPIECEYYDELRGSLEYLQPCFRICRDLAFYEDEKTEIGDFFLSCRELGLRLGVTHKTASIYLQELVECEIIKVISTGRMTNRRASEYHWMLMP